MLFVILALILAGIVLLVVEVIFIPGTTVVGLLGLGFVLVGIAFSFTTYGNAVGVYVLLGTGLTGGVTLWLSFRRGAWNRFSLKTSNSSRVNEGQLVGLEIGEEGVAISALRPMGKAEFRSKTFEVTTLGDYIASGSKVKIVQLQPNQVIVETINQ